MVHQLANCYCLSKVHFMFKILAMLVLVVASLTFAVFEIYSTSYPFVLASEEARKSLEVTPSQMLELRSAELSSDMIAYGIFSALMCGALAACCSRSENTAGQLLGLAIGLVVGAIAGAGMGWIGHWLELSPAFVISDPMIYSVVRWSIMLLPVAIAAGIATSISTFSPNEIGHAVMGAILGAVSAAAVYSVVAGSVTTIEARSKILPFHDANRVLIVAASIFCMGVGIILQLHRKGKVEQ